MKKYKFLLFDWDGTLVNSLPIWIRAYKKLFHNYGIIVTDKEILSIAYGDPKGCVYFGIPNYDYFNRQLFSQVRTTYYKAVMFKNALNILTLLNNNSYKLALITNTPNTLVRSYFKKNKVPKLFDVIITRDDVSELKPSPEGYKKALSKLKVTKNLYKTVMVIGDSVQDMIAGNKLGIDCTYIASGKKCLQDKIKFDYKINTLNDLKKIIDMD